MKKLMPLLAFVFWANFTVADDQNLLPQKDCNEIKNGVLYLLTVAGENWKALETNHEGTPEHLSPPHQVPSLTVRSHSILRRLSIPHGPRGVAL